jgi:hypothetical protein
MLGLHAGVRDFHHSHEVGCWFFVSDVKARFKHEAVKSLVCEGKVTNCWSTNTDTNMKAAVEQTQK